MKRSPSVIFLLALLALGGVSLGSSSAQTIKIGFVAPLTGEVAVFGISDLQGARLAVEEWNAAGDTLGRKFELVIADDRGDSTEALNAFTHLIKRERVVGIVGAVMSKISLVGAPLAQDARIPMISPTSTNPRVTQVGDFIFRACFIDPFQGELGAAFARADLGAERAGVIFDQGNDYALSLAETFRDSFTARGGQVLAYEGHDSGAQDFHPLIQRILATAPDVIYCPDYYFDAVEIAKQLRGEGFSGPILGGDGWDTPDLVQMGGEAVEECFFTNHWAISDPRPRNRDFVDSYRSHYNQSPDALSALGYEATWLLMDAIRRAGSTDGIAIRDALRDTETQTLTGQFRFDRDRNPIKAGVIIEIKDGAQVYRTSVEP